MLSNSNDEFAAGDPPLPPVPPPSLPPRTARQRIFNLPGVIVALVALLAAIHLFCKALPIEQSLTMLRTFAFVPGRFTAVFAPDRIAEALAAAEGQGKFGGEIALFFLGDGKPLWWTPLTYAFLHGSWVHLGFNCLWLVAFGSPVARRFGVGRFLAFCAATAIAGAAVHYVTHYTDLQPVIGASAVVSGTMAAAARFMFQPPVMEAVENGDPRLSGIAYRQPALPLRAVFRNRTAMSFLIFWFVANLLVGFVPAIAGAGGAAVAWEAHVGGFLLGFLAFPFFDRPLPQETP